MELIYENNRAIVKIEIEKQEVKKIIKENTSVVYKKFMENYFEEMANTTTQQLFLMSYFIVLKTRMFEDNSNIWTDIDITHDKEKFYIRIKLANFYDVDLTDKTNEQLEFLIKNKLNENEKVVLSNYLSLIPEYDEMIKGLKTFTKMSYNVDNLLKEYKEALSEAKSKGETLNRNIKTEINARLFGSYIIYILKNASENDSEFLEENYDKEKTGR